MGVKVSVGVEVKVSVGVGVKVMVGVGVKVGVKVGGTSSQSPVAWRWTLRMVDVS